MEMRACEDVDEIGQDLTTQIPPIAFSLSDSFLHCHCSSCFHPLLNPHFPPFLHNYPINSHSIPILYCSSHCSNIDSPRHVYSGEYHLFLILQSQPTTWQGDTSDLRTALRLLFVFDKLGFLSPQSDRIAGLMSNREKLKESEENLARIREGGRLISLARRMRDGDIKEGGETREEEEKVLCLVLTNAVEVQISEVCTLGIAVYGSSFSWINHSCSPNACYRFSLVGSDSDSPDFCESRIIAHGDESILRRWVCDESKLNNDFLNSELCDHGPRIIVRSIKPIKKCEEVCVSYTDLLQPKSMRQSELWSRYRFICSCGRCSASPLTYVDRVLQEDSAANYTTMNLSWDHNFYRNEASKELGDYLDETISEYLLVGNPKSCCEKLENILDESFREEQLQLKEGPSWLKFKLHPLHHLSLNAYITLASAYKIHASNLSVPHSGTDDHRLEAFELSKTSAAYSLLLAGATHHLFLSESSLIATTANYWVSAGDSLLGLARNLIWNLICNRKLPELGISFLPTDRPRKCSLMEKVELDLVCRRSQNISMKVEFEEISKGFIHCASRISCNIWPFLTNGHRHLVDIKDPIDFSWLGMTKDSNAGESQYITGGTDVLSYCGNGGCCGCSREAEEERISFFWLGVHCLLYGGYLASICYGHPCYLIGYVRNLLAGS